MLRRQFLGSCAGALGALAQGAAPRTPNILVILCDDLGYGDAHCYYPEGLTATPRIDRLAREGVRFTDAHAPSSVCTPTRYGLLTGRYSWRTRLKQGVLDGYSPNLIEAGRPTLGTLGKQRGYRTGCFGKWHLGLGDAAKTDYSRSLNPSPLDHGFDEFFGIPASLDMPPYLWVDGRQAVEQPTSTIETNGAPPRGAFWRGGPIAPSFRMEEVLPSIAARASRFIRESAKARRPFLAYVALNAPHTPWVPGKPYLGKSRAGLYGDFVAQVDDAAGSVLDACEQAGVSGDTLVMFASDNGAPWSDPDVRASGGHRANATWRGQKADIHEAGHRVPFIVRWPGKAPRDAIQNRATVCLVDIFATTADALGIPLRDGMGEDSFSVLPALASGTSATARLSTVHHSSDGMFAVRKGEWKLIEGLGSGGFTEPRRRKPAEGEPPGQLYNLAEDPRETRNLYADRPQVAAELTALLESIRRSGRSRGA